MPTPLRIALPLALAAAIALALRRLLRRPPAPAAGPAAGPGRLETEGPRVGDEDLAAATSFPEDATLADRVRSQLFRDDDVPKEDVVIDAAAGVVTLRGGVPPAMVEEIATRAAAVEGVVRVENRLHAAGG